MSDFVSMPMDKLTNRRNFFSRIERLERNLTRPSATAVQLGEIAQNTGNLVVDGEIAVVNRTDGIADVRINDNGLTIRNQEGALFFDNTISSTDTVSIFISGDNDLSFQNTVNERSFRYDAYDPSHVQKVHALNYAGWDVAAGAQYKVDGFPIGNSGTYTPNIDASSNVTAASIPGAWTYSQDQLVVSFAGAATIDPAAAGAVTIAFSIPVPSTFTTAFQASGVASSVGAAAFGNIASTAGDLNITLSFTAVDTASRVWRIVGMYQIV